jgi:Na+/melibiose symporter-like transporter
MKTKLAFGVGSGAETIALYSVSSFGLLFYNQLLGLPAHLAGLAISASLVLDGLSDPIVGSLSDRTRSRLGRRHLYMFAAPIPIALSLFAIFNPPNGLGQAALMAWFAISIVALRWSMTFFHTPHLAMGGELSSDYTERSKVMAYNSIFGWAGGSLTTFLALRIFFPATPDYPRGLLNPDPWAGYAFAISAVTMVILFASAWFTRDRIPFLPKPAADAPGFSPTEFVRDIGKALSNRNYVWLLIGYFFLSLMIGLREGLRLYVNTFYWGLTSEQLSWFILGSFVGFVAAFGFVPRLHKRFDKKRTIMASAVVYAIAPAIPILLGMAGVLRPETPGLLPILIAFAAVSYGSVSVMAISVMSALADVADENELKHGIRQEGVLYSTRALAAKLDQAVGTAVAGFALTFIQFPVKATPGHVAPAILHNLALWDSVIAGVPGLIAVLFYARYRITRQSYEATKAALVARRGLVPGGKTITVEDAEEVIVTGAAPAAR